MTTLLSKLLVSPSLAVSGGISVLPSSRVGVLLCFREACTSNTDATNIRARGHVGWKQVPKPAFQREAHEKAQNPSAGTQTKKGGQIPHEVSELFKTLREEALRRLHEFSPIHLFSLTWAYSTARLLDEDLLRRVTNAAIRIGRERDSQQHRRKHKRRGQEPANCAIESIQRGRFFQPEQPSIIGEGAHWLALYKPPFWQVSADAKEAAKAAEVAPFQDDADDDEVFDAHARKPKMQLWTRHNFSKHHPICNDKIEAFGLMHRLDVQTSGIILCAKTYVGAYWLRLQWCSYVVDKEYVCVVHGWVDRSVREINQRIRVDKKKARHGRKTIYTNCTVSKDGKPSYTELHTLAHLTKDAEATSESADKDGVPERYSLVVVKLHTGRTHQIRVHMKWLGHPLVSDNKYARKHFADDTKWCHRNFLHTYHLSFEDIPAHAVAEDLTAEDTTSLVDVYCPIPEDLCRALARLKPVGKESEHLYKAWLSSDSEKLSPFKTYSAGGGCSQ